MQDRLAYEKSALCIVATLLISAATFKAVYDFQDDWTHLQEAAQGVLEGRPHWPAYQNRLLGPITVQLLSLATGSYGFALHLFNAGGIAAHNLLLLFLTRHSGATHTTSLACISIWSLLFVFLQHYWFYTWDIYEVIIFTVVAYYLAFGCRQLFLYLLFFVAILNRESAIFIPMAIILLRIFEVGSGGPGAIVKLLRSRDIVLPAFLIFSGAIHVKLVRDILFVESYWGTEDVGNDIIGNRIQILRNLQDIFVNNLSNVNLVHTLIFLVFTAFLIFKYFSITTIRVRAAIVFYVFLSVMIITFGLFNETRMLFPLVSLGIFITLRVYR